MAHATAEDDQEEDRGKHWRERSEDPQEHRGHGDQPGDDDPDKQDVAEILEELLDSLHLKPPSPHFDSAVSVANSLDKVKSFDVM